MKKQIILFTTFMLFLVSAHAEDLVLGVLEQSQTALGHVEKSKITVRPLFGKSGKGWVALNSGKSAEAFNIKSMSWTAAFDGRNIGQVVSAEPEKKITDAWTYPRDYGQNIISRNGAVEIKNSRKAFTGWCGPPTIRPVVLVSRPNYKDPDGWKPFKPEISVRRIVFSAFKDSVGKDPICAVKDSAYVPFQFDAGNLKFLKSYKSSRGELIQITLDREYTQCDDELGEGNKPRWFLVKDGGVQYIGEGMELVDAGDYDADGKSEVLFWHSGYNEDGYVLIYNDLRDKLEFIWIYH